MSIDHAGKLPANEAIAQRRRPPRQRRGRADENTFQRQSVDNGARKDSEQSNRQKAANDARERRKMILS